MPDTLRLMTTQRTTDMSAGDDHRRLARLGALETAFVVGIEAEETNAKRLADLGFVPGVRVQMVRRGAPCIVLLDGTRIGLGKEHQRAIWTAPVLTPPADDAHAGA